MMKQSENQKKREKTILTPLLLSSTTAPCVYLQAIFIYLNHHLPSTTAPCVHLQAIFI